jgi:C-terminal peptidase prc
MTLVVTVIMVLPAASREMTVARDTCDAARGSDDGDLWTPATPEEETDDETETDYWEDVDFGPDDFAEVRRFVKLFYIDPSFDKRLAWITAASFALRSMKSPRDVLPEDYWKRRKKIPGESRRFGGDPLKLRQSDPFVLVEVLSDEAPPRSGSLTPRDIAARRQEIRKRHAELSRAYSRIPFTESDFERVMAHIESVEKDQNTGYRRTNLYVAASKGYLAALDPHSTVLSSKAWEESQKSTSDGSFEGIGAILTKRGEDTVVETPMEDQPAHRAGIRAGDVVLAVDGRTVVGWPLHRVVKRIRGEKGSAVVLTIRRLGVPRDLDFEIRRDHIAVRNIQQRMIPHHPDMGHIKVTGFVPSTRTELRRAIEELESKTLGGRLRGLVLDLRNNPGGLLHESVEIADDFLDEGVIVSVRNTSDPDEIHRAKAGSYDFPVVVLVDSSSASASEILASAIQENGRGIVVGDRTFGKASVQRLLNPLLRRDYYIKLTVARYYAPGGRTIQVTGVTPDIQVPTSPGGEPPVTFREEDLAHHLPRLAQAEETRTPNKSLATRILDCDRRMGIAEPLSRAEPNPQVKVDFQVLKAADYLECMYSLGLGPASSSDTAIAP